jgi:hypothetical protein
MVANSKTGTVVVGYRALGIGHRRQWLDSAFFAWPRALLSQEGAFQLAGTLDLPEGIATMLDTADTVERANACEQLEFIAVE